MGNLTRRQVEQMAYKMKNMSKDHFESVIGNISNDAFTGAIEAWGRQNWTNEQVETITNVLQDSSAWGNVTTWTYEQAQSLGSMLNNLPSSVEQVIQILQPSQDTTTEPADVTSTQPSSLETTTTMVEVDSANHADLRMAAITLAVVAMTGLSVTSAL